MKKVIFILSVGHSGSTLLDIMLGQFNNIFSTGELKHLTWQYYRQITNDPTTQKCTCSKSFDQCEVWSKVIDDLANFRNVDIKDVPELVPLKHFDSLSYFTNLKKDKILRYIYNRNLVYKLIPQHIFTLLFKKVNENNIILYQSIYDQNPNVDYIIDSSKNIIRYNELKKTTHTFPIILIRNINEVLKSKYVKGNKNQILAWQNYYNKKCYPILKNLDEKEFHIVSYEMFIHNPEQVINELSEKMEIDTANFKKTVNMDNYHLVAGNPMRYESEITIKQKEHIKEDVLLDLERAGLNKFFIDRI